MIERKSNCEFQTDGRRIDGADLRRSFGKWSVAAFAWLALAVAAAPVWALDVGDRAPALHVDEWIQGKPVNLIKESGSRIFMVEFWATWCPPCKASVPRLSDFQKKYEKDLTIIGVTSADDRGNTPSAVRRFVKEHRAHMIYTVAMDKELATSLAYLGDQSVVGIPYAFLVARDGKIAWEGSPLEPELDDVLAELVAGTYDVDAAKIAAQVNQRFQALQPLYEMGHYSAVWDGLIGILKLDPANALAMQLLQAVQTEGNKSASAFRSWARDHIEENRKNPKATAQLALVLCENADLATRFPDLALEAAKAAYDSSTNHPAIVYAAYARALYEIGDVDRAIEMQSKAVAAESDPNQAQDVLDYYKKCKKLRDDQ